MTKKHWPYYAMNKDSQILISHDGGETWQPFDETNINIDLIPLPEWDELIKKLEKQHEKSKS